MACERRAADVTGNQGTSWYVTCPPGCETSSRPIWGTDIYTDDSTICAAAIHAGAFAASAGGAALVTWVPAQPTYVGSERNGVKSQDYGTWPRGFFLQALDAQGKPKTPAPALAAPGTARMSCAMSADLLTGPAGTKWTVTCPSNCDDGNLWGTDIYTADSSVCRAAAHAGVITAGQGGTVKLTFEGPQPKMLGSKRNGIESAEWGPYERTFRVSK